MKFTTVCFRPFNIKRPKHSVTKQEVEEICIKPNAVFQAKSNRIRAIGQTNSGRTITVILAKKSNKDFYPVSARDASRKERRDQNN